jgi:NAD-dependent dihydropyrimidine dehydrogenase PreA subunit
MSTQEIIATPQTAEPGSAAPERRPIQVFDPPEESVRSGPWIFLKVLPKRVFQTVFRSVPYPTKPRLIRIGNPGRQSPVLVTTNYDLTVRRVCHALLGMDCYLLVAPAAGIDVWCAAGGGRFTVDSIISILKTSRIAELVDHRRLLLPEMCANGINMFEVRRRTGWTAVFGPADARDVPEFIRTKKKTEKMLRVTFTPLERLEMATAMWGSLSLRYSILPLLLFGWLGVGWFVGLLAAISLALSLACFWLPGKTFVQKAAVIGLPLIVMMIITDVGLRGHFSWFTFQVVSVLVLGTYLAGASFPSYSPLWQCGYSKLFFGYPVLELSIVEEDCIGCKLCDQVCPVECFSPTASGKVIFSQPDLCEGCMACLIQCPTNAIINEIAVEHQRLSQCG